MKTWASRPKKPLEDRAQAMRNRNAEEKRKKRANFLIARAIPDAKRVARLKVIRKYLGLGVGEFAELLGLEYTTMHQLLNGDHTIRNRQVPVPVLKLAEKEMASWRAKTGRRLKPKKEFPVSPDIDIAPEVKNQIVMMAAVGGKTKEEIATELSMRPEIVEFCLKDTE